MAQTLSLEGGATVPALAFGTSGIAPELTEASVSRQDINTSTALLFTGKNRKLARRSRKHCLKGF